MKSSPGTATPSGRRQGGPPRTTISDVAQRAGVAISTVSRVLNDGPVSSPTRTKVQAAIRELGYKPNAGARGLATGMTGAIGLVIPFFTSPSAVQRLRGALDALDATDHEMILCNVADPAQRDEYLSRRAPLDRVDGLLIVSLSPTRGEVAAIAAAQVPTVLVDASHRRLPSLVADDVAGGRMATEHLIELGHERIAFVGDSADPRFGFVSSDRRLAGYREALRAAGLPADPALCRIGPHGHESAHRLTRALLSLPAPPTAVFAASDTQALGVLEAATCEGFSVPGDLSVIGFDDLEVAGYVGLTTIDQALDESGRRGVRRLLRAIDGEPDRPLRQTLALRLKARRTTGPPR